MSVMLDLLPHTKSTLVLVHHSESSQLQRFTVEARFRLATRAYKSSSIYPHKYLVFIVLNFLCGVYLMIIFAVWTCASSPFSSFLSPCTDAVGAQSDVSSHLSPPSSHAHKHKRHKAEHKHKHKKKKSKKSKKSKHKHSSHHDVDVETL